MTRKAPATKKMRTAKNKDAREVREQLEALSARFLGGIKARQKTRTMRTKLADLQRRTKRTNKVNSKVGMLATLELRGY